MTYTRSVPDKIVTRGVNPQLSCAYRSCRLKQYFKLGAALCTELVMGDTRDFGFGRRIRTMNWTALQAVGDSANQRSLRRRSGLPAPALAFGDPRIMAVLASLVRFSHLLVDFTNRELVDLVPSLWDQPCSSRQATCDLRRLHRKALSRR